jgi:hypothetical protein
MRHEDLKRFAAVAELRLNDRHIELTGAGVFDAEQGRVAGDYEIRRLPDDIDPLVFKTVLITGYPSVCEAAPGQNPFKHGSYRYRREVDLGVHGRLAYSADCRVDAERPELTLDSRFDVEGALEIPTLMPAQPVVETWVPDGRRILGRFTIAWPRADGQGFVLGDAKTIYEIPDGAQNIDRVRHRLIEFAEASATSRSLRVVQISKLI